MGFKDKGLRNICRLLLLVSVSALGACVSRPMNPPVVIKAPETFTNSFQSIRFQLLPENELVRLTINNRDSSFRFEGGSSYFEALTLPDLPQPYEIKVESEVVTTKSDLHGTLLYPVLTFLNAEKQFMMTLDDLPYVLKEPVTGINFMRAAVQISDQLADARYMIVHTQDDKLDHAIARGDGTTVLRTGGYQTMMFAPITKPRYRVNFINTGRVRITAAEPEKEVQAAPPAPNY